MAQSNPIHQGVPGVRADVDRLVSFAKEELAAAQTYEKAMASPPLQKHYDVLARAYASHRARSAELGERIGALGGEVPESPGMWGSLGQMLAGAAAAISENLAISLLEESEDRLLKHYREHLDDLDAVNREFILERLLPAQNQTHASLSGLKHAQS